jgi:hypothetical protein
MVATVSEYPALQGRRTLLDALDELHSELQSGATWENDTLPRFLEAFSALLGSVENAYVNTGREVPTNPWEVAAEVIRGARSYE